MKTGIIGGGNVGISATFAVAEKGTSDVVLYDLEEGRGVGKALDLFEAAPLRNYEKKILGTNTLEDLFDSDILVIAAGMAEQEGKTNDDIFDANYPLVKELSGKIKAAYSGKDEPIIIVVTNPADAMTAVVLKETGYSRKRVFGVGTALTSYRLKHLIAKAANISPVDVDAIVMGSNGDNAVVLERFCRISGLPLNLILSDDAIKSAIDEALAAESKIVDLMKLGGSFYLCGEIVGLFVDAIARDTNKTVLVSAQVDDKYNLSGEVTSVPAKLGESGIKRVYMLPLTDDEQTKLTTSVNAIKPFFDKIN